MKVKDTRQKIKNVVDDIYDQELLDIAYSNLCKARALQSKRTKRVPNQMTDAFVEASRLADELED